MDLFKNVISLSLVDKKKRTFLKHKPIMTMDLFKDVISLSLVDKTITFMKDEPITTMDLFEGVISLFPCRLPR